MNDDNYSGIDGGKMDGEGGSSSLFSVRQTKEGLVFLESSAIARYGVTNAFMTRRGGVSAGPFSGLNLSPVEGEGSLAVETNWLLLSRAFDIPRERFLSLSQVHGNDILVLEDLKEENRRRALFFDGVVTAMRGVPLCIKTADCVPILLFDHLLGVIGAVHAGWRGTSLGIAGRAVAAMEERFGSHPRNITAVIGPSIGPCCYEVDEKVFNAFQGNEYSKKIFTMTKSNKWMFDLGGANREELVGLGLYVNNISHIKICTSCANADFYSHRGEKGKTGRQVSFIML